MIFLVEVRIRDASINYYPEDFPYWLRDENGQLVDGGSRSGTLFFIDFTQPGMQDIIVQQAIAVAKCGLFDGIFFDWFTEGNLVLPRELGFTEEIEEQAKDNILKRIRASVRDDFLIILNTNRFRTPRRAWAVNGLFMETLRDKQWHPDLISKDPYTIEGLKKNRRHPPLG